MDWAIMKVLTRQECIAWCRDHSIVLNDRSLPDLAGAELKFEIPNDTQKRIYLSRRAMEEFADEPTVLVWLNDWSVWPSGQRMHIFDRLRMSYGENRPIIEAPAQVFQQLEIEDAISFVTLAVIFLWDCYVITPNRARFLFFSHDEYGLATQSRLGENVSWLRQSR